MNLNAFLKGYPSVLFDSSGDHVFETLRVLTRGHCSARQAKLLNYASTFLSEKECYLEIGTYTGYTLCSAGLESMNHFVGFDNFSELYSEQSEIKNELSKNVKRYLKNYMFNQGDFRQHDLDKLLDGKTIGVFLVDGKHTKDEVLDSIAWAKPYLSRECLIMFDDTNASGVMEAVAEVSNGKGFNLFFQADSFYDAQSSQGMKSDPYIHNGFALATYRGEF